MKCGTNRRHPSRVERSAQQRRARSQEHLARVRARESKHEAARPRFSGSWLLLALGALSVTAGAAWGTPLGGYASRWLSPTPLSIICVRGTSRLDAAEVATATGLDAGTLLGRHGIRDIEARLLQHSWISGARLLLLPSGVLLVEIREHIPEAVVTAKDPSRGPQVTLVDPNGTPFAPARAGDIEVLPHLIPSGAVSAGIPDARLALALALARRLPAHGLPGDLEIFIAPRSDPEGLALRLPELPGRVVIGWEDFDARLERLTVLLTADLVEVAEAARIDLRFADQAVLQSLHPRGAEQAAAARGVAAPPIETPAG